MDIIANMGMHYLASTLKQHLKRIGLLRDVNSTLKAFFQEHKVMSEMREYHLLAKASPEYAARNEPLDLALRRRLAKFNIKPITRAKGDLRIFFMSPLNNWEHILPLSLEPFGAVSTFMWQGGALFAEYTEWERYRATLNAELLSRFHKAHGQAPIDVVVGYVSDYEVLPTTLATMKHLGAVVFNMCWDDKLHFSGRHRNQQIGVASLAPHVDLNLTSSPDSIVKYAVKGGLAMFWPEAAHPGVHKTHDLPFEFDVSFVGQKYGWRPKFIDALRKRGITVACFGQGWENGPLSDSEMVKLYSRSRINLGFAGVGHSKKLMCLKGRDFEVPMSGGLYLTQNNPELALVYQVGREIVTYESEDDCAQKIRWLLDNPVEASSIRERGRRRALKDHTWDKRFTDIFEIAGVLSRVG
jgi:hypothetical protein